jgi:ankyrin repeat protein
MSSPEEAALWKAAEDGDLDQVKSLLQQQNVNVNAQHSEVPTAFTGNHFRNGWTALHFASQCGHLEVVRYLVQDGKADVEVKIFDRFNALHLASLNGHLKVVQYLLQDGKANLMAKARNGWTVLDVAKLGGKDNVVQFLSDCINTVASADSDEDDE